MFHWFFIEGLHLHNVLTIDVFPASGGARRYVLGCLLLSINEIGWLSIKSESHFLFILGT